MAKNCLVQNVNSAKIWRNLTLCLPLYNVGGSGEVPLRFGTFVKSRKKSH